MEIADNFLTFHYRRHNQRRQEHLASLGLPIAGKTVLEVGAGIGDHTSFFIDRHCSVTSTDGRQELLDILQRRFPRVVAVCWDIESPPPKSLREYQIVYAYGILYHTKNPGFVLENLAGFCTEMLLLETCVSFGDEELIHLTSESIDDPTQALRGTGCRPTRPWIFNSLKKLFPFVFVTKTQPWHEEFPIDWTKSTRDRDEKVLTRSVFVATKIPLRSEFLSTELSSKQERG
jgi:hypothetical protein